MRRRQAGMVFILITLLLDVIGLGLIFPILPQLVTELSGGSAAQAAFTYGLLVSIYALMLFIFAPILGSLSDRFGRRPLILIALLGLGINYLLLALAPSLNWLIVARIVTGIMGASITTANAYIADISTAKNRAQNFGLVGATFGLGFILGPALGGILGAISPRLPFYAAALLALLNCLYALLILPESLPADKRRAFSWRKASPLSLLQLRRYPIVAGLAVAYLFWGLAQRGLESVWVLYTNYRFGWLELQNGLALALVGVMAALVQGYLIRLILPRLGERRAILLSLTISATAFVLYGLAYQGWMMLAIIVVSALGGIAVPAIQGLVAGAVPSSEQGQVQGSLTSLLSLSAIIAPLISTGLFGYFTGVAPLFVPGAPFFAGALLMAAALLAIVRVFRRHPQLATQP